MRNSGLKKELYDENKYQTLIDTEKQEDFKRVFEMLQKTKEKLIPNLKDKIIIFSILNILIISLSLIGLFCNKLFSDSHNVLLAILVLILSFTSLIFSAFIIKYCISV